MSSAVRMPVIIVLVAMVAFALFGIGWIITETVKERRHMNVFLPKLLDEMKSGKKPLNDCIKESGLLARQKAVLLELTSHPDFTTEERQSLADNLLEKEESHYDGILKWTEVMSKLAPMAGLLGTLIPLGPGS